MGLLADLLRIVALSVAAMLGLTAAGLLCAALVTRLIAWRIEHRYPAADRRVAVEGGRLAYLEDGPGEGARATIVLLHGASANAYDPMEGVGRPLAKAGFRVIAFDRPGYGNSDRIAGSRAASPAFQGQVLEQALDRLGTGPVILLGHSWSGALALRMAIDHPERVMGLMLVAPVAMPLPRQGMPWWADLALTPPITWLLTQTIAVPAGMSYLPLAARMAFRPEPPIDRYVAASRAPLILRPGPALANIQDLAGLPEALIAQSPLYRTIRLPTVILAGEDDPIVVTRSQAEPLSRVLPEARLITIPGAGHMVTYTAAPRLVREVEALLTAAQPAKPP